MPTYNKFESSLSLSMLSETLKNQQIKEVLVKISTRLLNEVFPLLANEEHPGFTRCIRTLAQKHSMEDKFIGALLPKFSADYLKSTNEGRKLLLASISDCLNAANTINTQHDFLALIKVIDDMALVYDVFQSMEMNPFHLRCRSYIAPTNEEVAIRSPRVENFLATTYGIGTDVATDIIPQTSSSIGSYSGKARFFILPVEQRKRTWFEKLADQSSFGKPSLPLIASPSNATAKSLIMAQGLKLFVNDQGTFDFDSAQIFANCLMAYLVYCGHHSALEVMEIWNRQLDFVAIEHPEQLPSGIIPSSPTTGSYFQELEAVERKLPYAHVGNYSNFLNHMYAQSVMERANQQLETDLDLRMFKAYRASINLMIPPKVMEKYNTATSFELSFTEEGLTLLKNKYKHIRGLPPYIHNTLKGRPTPDRELILQYPHLYACSEDFNILIMPNRSTNWDNLRTQHLSQKNDPDGLTLVGWIIDPRLFEQYGVTKQKNCHSIDTIKDLIIENGKKQTAKSGYQYFQRADSQEEIATIELKNPESPFLATILDLTPKHIPLLKKLKELSKKHIIDNFGVNYDNDIVEMYFHFPYPDYTTTLHMHIRVNHGRHPMERGRSFTIDEVISCLDKGNKISELILKRKPYFSDNFEILRDIKGIEIKPSINPFILDNNTVQNLFDSNDNVSSSNINP